MKNNDVKTITMWVNDNKITLPEDIALKYLANLENNSSTPVQTPTLKSTKSTKTTPKKAQKVQTTPTTYDPAKDSFTDFAFVCTGNKITITHKDGSYLYEKAPRQALNTRIKNAGGVYDSDVKAWVFKTNKKAADFIKNNTQDVSPEELNTIYDKWNKRAEKRVNK